MKNFLLASSVVLYFLVSEDYNLFAFENEEDNNIWTNICLESKQKGFKELDSRSRLISLYLNSLLDYIVENNLDLIKEKGFEDRKFCVTFIDSNTTTSHSNGYGLITFDLSLLFTSFNENDTGIATVFSHELAHEILGHSKILPSKREELYQQFLEDDSIETQNKSIPYFNLYYQKHPSYIKLKQEQEIEADNLGLQIYLNSKFVPYNYAKFFLNMHEDRMSYLLKNPKYQQEVFSKLSNEDNLFFKSTSTTKGCVVYGNHARRYLKFDSFMNRIKYIPNLDDEHPTGCWRYWNIVKKIEQHPRWSLSNNNLLDVIYLNIDLNEYERLDDMKDYFRKKSEEKLNETIYDILENIVLYGSSDIKFTIDTISKKDGFNDKENTLILRFYHSIIKPLVNIKVKTIDNSSSN